MSKTKAIREYRANIYDWGNEAQVMLDSAERGKRSLSASERKQFDDLHSKIEAEKRDLEIAERTLDLAHDTHSAELNGSTEQNRVTSATQVLTRGQSFKAWAMEKRHFDPDEYRGLSIGAYLRSILYGPKDEVERRALSEGVLSGGGYAVPTALAAEVIDLLRARAVSFKAGATTLPLSTQTTNIARVLTDPVPVWHGEGTAETPSAGTFERVQMIARTLMTIVVASRELLADSQNIESALTKQLIGSMAVKLDQAALTGDGTGNSPTGIKNTTNVGSVSMGANGVAPANYSQFLLAIKTIREANEQADLQAVMSPRTEYEFAGLVDSQLRPLNPPDIMKTMPFFSTTSIVNTETQGTGTTCSRIIVGDYTDLLIGIRDDLRIEVTTERWADSFSTGFIAWLRADVQLEHPGSFAQIIGIL